MSEYTITKIESGVATITYSDGSYAHILMKDSMSQDEFDALAFDFAPKSGSVPSFATEGAKRNTKQRSLEDTWTEDWTQTRVDDLTSDEIIELAKSERNTNLANSDWVALKALESGSAVPDNWKTYRQELRDLPAAGTSKWNPSIALVDVKGKALGDGSYATTKGVKVNGITWPTKPS